MSVTVYMIYFFLNTYYFSVLFTHVAMCYQETSFVLFFK